MQTTGKPINTPLAAQKEDASNELENSERFTG